MSQSTSVREIHQAWKNLYEIYFPKLEVPEPTFTAEMVEQMLAMEEPRIPIFVHPEIGKEEIRNVAITRPMKMSEGSWTTLLRLDNREQVSGWLFVEASLDSPHRQRLHSSQGTIEDYFKRQSWSAMSLEAYVCYALYKRTYCERLPDKDGFSLLLGTVSSTGKDVWVYFHWEAGLIIADNEGSRTTIGLGARSVIAA